MLERIRGFIQYLFNKDLDLQERSARMVFTLAFFASIIGMGRVTLGADLIVLVALVPMCIISGLALKMAVKEHKTKKASWLLVISTNVILMPLVYIFSGGTDSGTPVWFVLGLVYVFMLFKGREFAIALSVSIASCFITYLISYLYPNILSKAPDRFYTSTDSYVTIVCISCFIGILLKRQIKAYDSERKYIEEQKEEIEQIARSKDTFFANMSHEIRTPINTIIGLNEMTLREDISDEIAENAINIQNASKMLLTTINDILDLSKLESGKMEMVMTQYEVSSIFSDMVNLIW
ncbi:MAG: fatty acid-binding protein DegV, partial [Butyrivibrio sp.]|nr:fatty acid-binding protein DegV [Butyrivibrio sp.]